MGQEVHGNNFNTPKRWFAQKDGGVTRKSRREKAKNWLSAMARSIRIEFPGAVFPEQ
jgi:hypothetical protein